MDGARRLGDGLLWSALYQCTIFSLPLPLSQFQGVGVIPHPFPCHFQGVGVILHPFPCSGVRNTTDKI